jgi:hypothetical protein
VPEERFTWFSEKVFPFESQWSLLHKFACWNALTVTSTHRLIGHKKCDVSNLAFRQFLDVRKFAKATGISEQSVAQSFPFNLVSKNARTTILQAFRYCPECLLGGFHSSLFQLSLYETCPIHNKKLKTTCPHCDHTIGLDTSGINIQKAYACPTCEERFCYIDQTNNITLEEGGQAVIREEGEYILTQKTLLDSHNIMFSLSYYQLLSRLVDGPKIRQIWNDMAKACRIHGADLNVGTTIFSNENGKAWNVITQYKAIKRQLYKTYVKPHARCLKELLLVGAVYEGFTDNQCIGCPGVHAFINWRMYWERRLTISELNFDSEAINAKYGELLEANHDEAIRIFTQECLASFYQILRHITALEKKDQFKILLRSEIESWRPFTYCWAICRDHDSGQAKFYVWSEPIGKVQRPYSKKHWTYLQRRLSNLACKLRSSGHARVS